MVAADVARLNGKGVATPSRHALQVSAAVHLLAAHTDSESDPGSWWHVLNHRCAANAYLRGRTLLALANIAAAEEISFNYNTTEFELSVPFHCWCDASSQRGPHRVRGYRYLSARERAALDDHVADHLRGRTV